MSSTTVSVVGAKSLQKVWEGPCSEGMCPFLGPDVVGFRTTSQRLECLDEVWAVWRALFLSEKKERVVIKASLSNCDFSSDFGDIWTYGCPKSPNWRSDDGDGTGSECTSSFEVYEHNVESRALEVIGQNWSGKMVAVCLEEWQLARVAFSCHLVLDLLCQEMQEACQGSPLSQCTEASLALEGQ